MSGTVVLDTHVWIWLITGDERIMKAGYLSVIEQAAQKHAVHIPAICAWEVAMLAAKRRIILSESTLEWIRHALSAPGLMLCPLTPEIACESAGLPGDFHGDPADRLIVASARILNAPLVTFDQKIAQYAREGYINVVDPRERA